MKRGLGKGLGSLFADAQHNPEYGENKGVFEADIFLIDPAPNQPRHVFDEEKIRSLADSITQHGVLQPIILRPNDDRYFIVAGERRYRAARMAGLKTIPAIVKEVTAKEQMELALIENIQREDLNPVEEANAIAALMQEHELTQEEVSQRIGRSRSAIANILRLLNLPPAVQLMLQDGRLSAGHAKALVAVASAAKQMALAEKIAAEDLSVRQTEQLVQAVDEEKPAKKKESQKLSMELQDVQNLIRDVFATKVSIVGTSQKGKIAMTYQSREDLERIYELLSSLQEALRAV